MPNKLGVMPQFYHRGGKRILHRQSADPIRHRLNGRLPISQASIAHLKHELPIPVRRHDAIDRVEHFKRCHRDLRQQR